MIFTDLDGTLLDHHNYSSVAARPALDRLARDGISVVLASSKTLAELSALMRQFGLTGPAIVENGASLILPDAWNLPLDEQPVFSPPYSGIIDILQGLKGEFSFQGFHDIGTEGIVRTTGLSPHQAELAGQRSASEPLLWEDSPEALEDFRRRLLPHRLKLIQGGRFVHVIGEAANKSVALKWLVGWLRQQGWQGQTLGLGDAPNDHEMLNAVDHAAIVNNPDSPPMPAMAHKQVYRTHAIGPAGWNEAIQHIVYSASPV